ncbi:MAG: DUF6175 family protein [Chitinivibrionales bacterium]
MNKTTKLMLTGIVLVSSMMGVQAKDSNLPVSQQATFVETYSPAEVTIQATGLGKNDKEAIIDLRKCAVNFVLNLGTDPLLNTDGAKAQFSGIAEDFFVPANVDKYISWESDKVVSSLKSRLPNGKEGMKITKAVRVNKKLLTDDLVAKGIIKSREELADAIGMPTIMVIPETPKGETPLEVFDKNPLAKHAAAVIESYLTARKYDVLVPKAMDQINEMTKLQGEVKGVEEDPGYQLALALGSDVYIVFAGMVYSSNKVTLQLKAYETTTGRLLGTETGYSASRPGPAEPLVEEAVNSAIDKVLQRLINYWQDDVKKGIQYKLVFKSISGSIDEAVKDKISDVMDETFALSKENVVSDKTLDYNVWAKKGDYNKSSKIYRHFRDALKSTAKLTQININKKLIIIGVEPL